MPTHEIMTVNGPIPATEMGRSLIHEHVFLDWTGADSLDSSQWDTEAAYEIILPYLEEARSRGVQTMLECTPAYLGRNPLLLKRLAESTGLQILTNTGYYGARKNKYLPGHAMEAPVDELVDHWVAEWDKGIDGTGIRPGFIKIGVDGDATLSAIHEKLIRAAARTHLQTGLTIVGHTGPESPAFAQLAVLQEEGVAPEAFVWTHAQGGTPEAHVDLARQGAWVSLDGMGWMAPDTTSNSDAMTLPRYTDLILNLKAHDLLHRLLIAHDAGWYTHGEPDGGTYKPYTPIFDEVIPGLRSAGFTEPEIRQLLIENPQAAYSIRVRTR